MEITTLMNNPYRISPKKEGKEMKYIYNMFKAIRTGVALAWRWLSWENFGFISLSLLGILTVGWLCVLLYGNMFLDHTKGDCYTSQPKDESIIKISREINWEIDNTIGVCITGNIECVNDLMQSEACK